MPAASYLAAFETTKEQRKSFVNDLLNSIDSGSVDPLRVHLHLKAIEDIIKQLTSLDEKTNKNAEAAKKYRAHLLGAAEKYGNKFQLFNAEFAIKETGSKYDFSQCNDNELSELHNQQEALTDKIKEREKFLKSVPVQGMDHVDSNGEVLTLYPPSKSSTTSIVVTLK